jgi:hypothetical protein
MRAIGMSVGYIDVNVQFMIRVGTKVPFLGRG